MNETVLFTHPTYEAFIMLLDNYEAEVMVPETVFEEELEEIDIFLNAILDTPVFTVVHEFLIKKSNYTINHTTTICIHSTNV